MISLVLQQYIEGSAEVDEAIEIRLRGAGMKPGLVRSHEIAEILAAIEDMVIAESLKREPSLRKEDIVVGLYEVVDESLGLHFKSSIAAIAIPAFVAFSQAMASNNYEAISQQSLKPLHIISGFVKRHEAVAELKISGTASPLAIITPNTLIPQGSKIAGATEIAAKILRVGGKVPKAMLELQDGSVIYCEIPVGLAIQLGHRLYETAIFTGNATWNSLTLEIEEFSINGLAEYPKQKPMETLEQLRSFVGNNLKESRDVNALVTFLRRTGETE